VAERDAADSASKAALKHYVWVNDKPVGLIDHGQLLFVHTDHRNAPLALTNQAAEIVWQASVADFLKARPAGMTEASLHANEHRVANAELGKVTFNLRGSNQYFDAESSLHYNTHRYFDPIAATYLSPDPLGLAAGPDLYAFALNAPHSLSDPFGLQPVSTTDWSRATYEEKLEEIVGRAVLLLPGEAQQQIGDALRQLVSPTNLATMGIVMGAFIALQSNPLGWVLDALLLVGAAVALDAGARALILAFIALHNDTRNATCERDIQAAARAFANRFVTGTGALAGGILGAWGINASGGSARIANGIRRTIEWGRNAVGRLPGTGTRTITAAQAGIAESRYGTFIPGRERNGAEVNAEYTARALANGPNARLFPPWANNRPVIDTWLRPGTAGNPTRIYVVEGATQAGPGGWATNRTYSSLAEARADLSLLTEFKNGNLVVREYTVIADIPVRQGTVGPLTQGAESYRGGGQQWEFLVDMRNNWSTYLTRNPTAAPLLP
jgi:RHS repeat-associated protein